MSRQDPKTFSNFYTAKRSNELRPPTGNSPATTIEGKKPKNVETKKKEKDKEKEKEVNRPGVYTNDFHELALQQKDERFRYLLKNGELQKIEKGGNIIFSQLPQIPNIWVCYRRPLEREANPEKLNLDSLGLSHMPLLEGEERLKMLTYQHNSISKIQNLISLPAMIYIDLYDNSIKEIENMDAIKNLKVLLLAKNNISKIKNLSDMAKLEVLDLHGNKISKIEGVSNLGALKSLNLSYNAIFKMENLDHVLQLNELNLKSNKVATIQHIKHLSHLEKLNLSGNKIEIKNPETCELLKLHSLKELSLEQNPCIEKEEFRQTLKYLYSLRSLDGKSIKKQKDKDKEKETNDIKHEEQYDHSDVLKLIMKQWEEEKQRVMVLQSTNSLKKDLLKNSCITGGHAEIEDETVLYIFGNSCEAVLGDSRYYDSVEKIKFEYILFEYIIEPNIMSLLRKFKKLRAVEFKRNYITTLLQVAKLESLPGLRVINIDKEDNPIFNCSFLKQFIVYRFPTVAVINRTDVKEADRSRAKLLFHNFDKMLQIPEKFFSPDNLRQFPCEENQAKKDKNYLKVYNKYISEVAESEVKKVTAAALKDLAVKQEFEKAFEDTMLNMVIQVRKNEWKD